jgi:hypothetical protein
MASLVMWAGAFLRLSKPARRRSPRACRAPSRHCRAVLLWGETSSRDRPALKELHRPPFLPLGRFTGSASAPKSQEGDYRRGDPLQGRTSQQAPRRPCASRPARG